MIAAFLPLLLQAAPVEAGLGAIGRQALPATGCAAYLWSAGERHVFVAMASAEPARLRLNIDGRTVDLARAEAGPAVSFGLPATAHYRAEGIDAGLDLTIATDPSLTQGGTVPGGTVTLTRPGRDAVVTPVAGLVGCASG